MSITEEPTLTVTRAEPNLGARVEGVTIGREPQPALLARLRALLLEHHVLVLPGLDLTALELEAFARQWGELLEHPATKHRDTSFIQFIPGSGANGKGTWHSDMTWHETPPIITMLHARRLPDAGGDTCFANQHLAYETMPGHLRAIFDGAEAYHSGKVFGPDVPDHVHPAVRTHDETGRKALYVNMAFTSHLVGREDEGRTHIHEAVLHATSVEFMYRHKWAVDDLVIWDNRSVMHCPSVDYDGQRHMHRAVVAGGRPA